MQGIKKVYEEVKDFFYYTVWYWGIRDRYLSIRGWFRSNMNRHYAHLLKTVFVGRPWDFGYLYNLEKAKMEEFLAYHETHFIVCEEDRQEMIKSLKLAITLLNIVMNETNYFHYDGDMEFEPISGSTLSRANLDKLVYHCDVNVNTWNIDRFVRNEEQKKMILMHPHELYIIKARYLYYKARLYYTELWWD